MTTAGPRGATFHFVATSTLPARARTASGTTVALKLLMAVTGLVFIGYVLLHMYGNLMVFGGADQFNAYAHHLRTFGEPMLPYGGLLWVIRVVLILSLIGHAYAAFALWSRAGKARATKYAVKKAVGSTLASRTMRWGGVALLLFVVFHLLHLTTHTIRPQGTEPTPFDNVVGSFQIWWVTLIYALAMLALAMHLRHGVWSAAQTLGLTGTARSRRRAKLTGLALAVVVAGGFLLPPLSILLGIVE